MGFRVIRPDELEWITRPHEPGEHGFRVHSLRRAAIGQRGRELALVAAELRLKLKEQRERLAKLGIEPTPAPAVPEVGSAPGTVVIPIPTATR